MNTKKILHKLLVASGLLVTAGAMQSCEDFLTVTPSNQITDEDFWNDRNDVEAVRSGAYKKMAEDGQLSKVLIWGELRSDNFTLAKLNNTGFYNLTHGILMPQQGMFDWGGFYSGINICNMVLERGQKMVDDNVDPTFSEGDWKPIKAEMRALRALYYFYLVRAFRDVPYISHPVTTDAEAMEQKRNVEATPGIAILGNLIDSLEVSKEYAAKNFGGKSLNKGRFTQRGIYALLADMNLWRACLVQNILRHVSKDKESGEYKGVSQVNIDDTFEAPQSEGSTDESTSDETKSTDIPVLYTAEGKKITKTYLENLRNECLNKAVKYSDFVINDIKREYDFEMLKSGIVEKEKRTYALIPNEIKGRTNIDEAYLKIWGEKNSLESVLEFQFNGASNSNGVYAQYLSSVNNGSLSSKVFEVNEALVNRQEVDPGKAFGKTDYRMLETLEMRLKPPYPYRKNLATSITINNAEDMVDGALVSYRSQSDANWPVYRLTDMMLIKAEAVARLGVGKNTKEIYEAFNMVNAIFARNNPALRPEKGQGSSEEGNSELKCKRLNYLKEIMDQGNTVKLNDKGECTSHPGYYPVGKDANALLKLVYQERRKEFMGEGKYWFDVVRQAEWSNNVEGTLSSFVSFPKSVTIRLRKLMSLYNPIYNEEYKIVGEEFGGKLKQNPVWARYATN